MGYSRSSIVQREDGLWKATIFYSYLYFWESMESETFKNLSDAQKWLLEKRCYQLVIEEYRQIKEEAKKLEEEKEKVMKTFSDALKSIPPPPKTPPPPPPVQTMLQDNINCESKPIEKKKKHHFIED